ncbi:hypothetical protein GCM10007417_10030 [Glycocaulis alkaliphilus]|nr:hypothetical protein GCM10007417_10030 [Glycocaulis alkaliphilus]
MIGLAQPQRQAQHDALANALQRKVYARLWRGQAGCIRSGSGQGENSILPYGKAYVRSA